MIVFAYVLAFFLAPLIAGIAALVGMPILLPLVRIPVLGLISEAALMGMSGFIAVWGGKLVFSWFGHPPTILMALMLGISFVLNHFRRVLYAPPALFAPELSRGIGFLAGIVIGAIVFVSA